VADLAVICLLFDQLLDKTKRTTRQINAAAPTNRTNMQIRFLKSGVLLLRRPTVQVDESMWPPLRMPTTSPDSSPSSRSSLAESSARHISCQYFPVGPKTVEPTDDGLLFNCLAVSIRPDHLFRRNFCSFLLKEMEMFYLEEASDATSSISFTLSATSQRAMPTNPADRTGHRRLGPGRPFWKLLD
jgi:hypothetical protein